MALQTNVKETAPNTLPEDFAEWDSGALPTTLPDNFDEFDDAPAASAAPKLPATPQTNASHVEELPKTAASVAPAPKTTPSVAPTPKTAASVAPAPKTAPSVAPALKTTPSVASAPKTIASLAQARNIAHAFDDAPVASAAPRPAARPVSAQTTTPHVVSAPPRTTASVTPTTTVANAEELSEMFKASRRKRAEEARVEEPEEDTDLESKSKRKKMVMFVAIGSVVLLLLLILIPLKFRSSSPKTPIANQPVAQPSTTAMTLQAPTTTPTSTSTPAQTKPSAAKTEETETQPTTPSVRSDMMSSQLNAPSRISGNIKGADKDAPPAAGGFGAGMMDALSGNSGGGVGSVFSAQNRPKVKAEAPRTMKISAGVAVGLLVQKSAPVYPPIARTARVSGTVVLEATISKTGAIENLHVVSGPTMLQQAALDAVRTWRYKPYMLNNEPIEVETTINVIFALGG